MIKKQELLALAYVLEEELEQETRFNQRLRELEKLLENEHQQMDHQVQESIKQTQQIQSERTEPSTKQINISKTDTRMSSKNKPNKSKVKHKEKKSQKRNHKRSMIYGFVAVTGLCALTFFYFINRPSKIDPFEYSVLDVDGYISGQGNARISLKRPDTQDPLYDLIDSFIFEVDHSTDLSNGDVLTITLSDYDQALMKSMNVKLDSTTKTLTIDTLPTTPSHDEISAEDIQAMSDAIKSQLDQVYFDGRRIEEFGLRGSDLQVSSDTVSYYLESDQSPTWITNQLKHRKFVGGTLMTCALEFETVDNGYQHGALCGAYTGIRKDKNQALLKDGYYLREGQSLIAFHYQSEAVESTPNLNGLSETLMNDSGFSKMVIKSDQYETTAVNAPYTQQLPDSFYQTLITNLTILGQTGYDNTHRDKVQVMFMVLSDFSPHTPGKYAGFDTGEDGIVVPIETMKRVLKTHWDFDLNPSEDLPSYKVDEYGHKHGFNEQDQKYYVGGYGVGGGIEDPTYTIEVISPGLIKTTLFEKGNPINAMIVQEKDNTFVLKEILDVKSH